MTHLNTLLGNLSSDAYDINDAGRVVGESAGHAYITGPNGVGTFDLGSLAGARGYSNAFGINDTGQVVGSSEGHAFITGPGPNGVGMTDLGTLGGGSTARGINDAGQVVGLSATAAGEQHAFITGPNGVGMMDLNSLTCLPTGYVITDAISINNVGQVIVVANIPEPETYALMLAGLGLIGFVAWRQKSGNRI